VTPTFSVEYTGAYWLLRADPEDYFAVRSQAAALIKKAAKSEVVAWIPVEGGWRAFTAADLADAAWLRSIGVS